MDWLKGYEIGSLPAGEAWLIRTIKKLILNGGSSLQGHTGIQGQTGVGIQGDTGVQGIQGQTGFGVQGDTGVQGIQGQTGFGVQGATGVQGIQGQTGLGVQGATGVGAQGATGVSGATGVPGIPGSTGVIGAITASDVVNAPYGEISALDVQSAINELSDEKFPRQGGTVSGYVEAQHLFAANGNPLQKVEIDDYRVLINSITDEVSTVGAAIEAIALNETATLQVSSNDYLSAPIGSTIISSDVNGSSVKVVGSSSYPNSIITKDVITQSRIVSTNIRASEFHTDPSLGVPVIVDDYPGIQYNFNDGVTNTTRTVATREWVVTQLGSTGQISGSTGVFSGGILSGAGITATGTIRGATGYYTGGICCDGLVNGANSSELGFLSGVTSAIQTQLNNKADNSIYSWTRGTITGNGWANVISTTLPNSTTSLISWEFDVLSIGATTGVTQHIGIVKLKWRNAITSFEFISLSGTANVSFGFTGTLAINSIFNVYAFCSTYPSLTIRPNMGSDYIAGGSFSSVDPSMTIIDTITYVNEVNGVVANDVHTTGDIIFDTAPYTLEQYSNIILLLRATTASGSDTGRITICAGGATSSSRGSAITLFGANNVVNSGAIELTTVATKTLDIYNGSTLVSQYGAAGLSGATGYFSGGLLAGGKVNFTGTPYVTSTTATTDIGALYRVDNRGLVNYEDIARLTSGIVFQGGSSVNISGSEAAVTNTSPSFGTALMPAGFFQIGVTLRVRVLVSITAWTSGSEYIRLHINTTNVITGTVWASINTPGAVGDYICEFNICSFATPSASSLTYFVPNTVGPGSWGAISGSNGNLATSSALYICPSCLSSGGTLTATARIISMVVI